LREIVRAVLDDLRPRGLHDLVAVPNETQPGKVDVVATASPPEKVGEVEIPPETEDEKLLDDGKHTLDERRALLAQARGKLSNEHAMAWILQAARDGRLSKADTVWLLKDIVSDNLVEGYRLETKEAVNPEKGGTHFAMNYFGLFDDNGEPAIGFVNRGAPGWEIGWAYVRPAPDPADPTGATPMKVLALDFLVNPSIERAQIKGVGSKMMQLAHEHFAGVHEGVVGEWYTLQFYQDASTGRPAMSSNLAKYIAARKTGLNEREAAMETWTCKRVKELYGGAELELKVRELYDISGPLPVNQKIVEVVMKPKA
jgi:hypothetical protein